MRLKLFVRATSWNLAGVVVSTILGLLVTTRVIKGVGAEAWGTWAMCLQVLGYVALAELGISSLITRRLAGSEKSVAGRTADAATLAAAVRSTSLQAGIGSLLLNVWFIWLPPTWLPHEALRPLIIAGNSLLLALPLKLFGQVLVASFDVDFIALTTSATNVLSAMASLIVVRAGFGLEGLAWVWGATQVALGVLLTSRLILKYPEAVPAWSQVTKARSALGRQNTWVVLGQLCHTVLNATDALLVGRLLGPTQASIYSCTDRALTVAASIPGAATEAVGPFLAHAKSHNPMRMRSAALGFTLTILCVAGWIVACVTAANGAFVKLWVGPEQFGGVQLTALLGLAFVLNQLGGALVQLIFYLGNTRVGTLAGVTSSILFLGLAYALLPRFGMAAAPLALGVSLLLGAMPYLFIAVWAATNGFDGQGRRLAGCLIRLGLLIGSAALLGSHLSISHIGAFFLATFLATLLSVILLGGYLYQEPLRSMIRDRLVAHRWGRIMAPVLNALEGPAMASHGPFVKRR